jgi:2,3-dihydroxybenzoate-AMP ligase
VNDATIREQLAHRYQQAGLWRNTTLAADLSTAAARQPSRTALICGERRISYGELDSGAARIARSLRSRLGLAPGAAALFQVGNIEEAAFLYYGSLKAGVIPVCALPAMSVHEVVDIAQRTAASAVLYQADFQAGARERIERIAAAVDSFAATVVVRGEASKGEIRYDELLEAEPEAIDSGAAALDPQAVVIYQMSGGTTASPKIVARRGMEYSYNSRAFADFLRWDEKTVVLHALPVMHNAGIVVAMQAAHLAGATFVLTGNTTGPGLLEEIERHQVTDVPCLPPTLVVRMLEAATRARRASIAQAQLGSIRHMLIAAQVPPPGMPDAVESTLGVRCLQSFGMCEGMVFVTPPDADPFIRKNTVGRPLSEYDEVKIVHPGTSEECDAGETGELLCRGPYTVSQYFRDPERDEVSFTADGYYRTGDLARRRVSNTSAVCSIEGRLNDLINRGGEKLSPEEIEGVVGAHPAVAACAVIGVRDAVLGERVCAVVVVNDAKRCPDRDEIADFARACGLAKYKIPDFVVEVEALPLTRVGKVARAELRKIVGQPNGTSGTSGSAAR